MVVYDLNGHTLQTLDAGDIDNVDVRQDAVFSGDTMPLIAASRRDSKSIEFYGVDRQAHRVVKLPQADLITDNDILGICLHNDRKTGNVSVFATGYRGVMEQWAIYQDKSGLLRGRKIRKIDLNAVTEGCVGDDELGRLYVAEENHGIVWVGTDPTGGDRLHWVDRIITGVLRQDVEGLTIYKTGPDSGYLLASSQGNSTVVVYDRKTSRLLGRFRVSANLKARVDEVTHADGIEAISQPIGNRFPMGFLVLQDDEDDPPSKKQNFKLVSFLDIVRALPGRGN